MVPFDPCLPVLLPNTRIPRWGAKNEDSMSWRQNQQTWSIYRLVWNNVDYCEDTINVNTAKTLRVKNQKNACSINVQHATSIYWCGRWDRLLCGEILSDLRYLFFQVVLSPMILDCFRLLTLNANLISKRKILSDPYVSLKPATLWNSCRKDYCYISSVFKIYI